MIDVIVQGIVQETADIRRITLVAADGEALPAFDAGAHVDVHMPNGIIRQYSLINVHAGDAYQLGVLREKSSRGGSVWLHENLAENTRLTISPPRNLFPIIKTARRHILFAGGIGITPILSMARHLASAGDDFELHYSVRNHGEAAFVADLKRLIPQEKFRLITEGREAAHIQLLATLAQPCDDTHVYVCGPSGYTAAVLDIARRQGWQESQLHTEAFSASASPGDGTDSAFTIQLARTGATITVAGNQTVVRALELHGIEVPISCEQGICGTCLTRVIAGIPDHRDQYLTDEERTANDQFTPCCSRAKSPELVLDL